MSHSGRRRGSTGPHEEINRLIVEIVKRGTF